MALGDYILCCKCEVKLIYDGDRNQREWWEERFGKPPEIECPDCKTPQRQPEQEPVATVMPVATVISETGDESVTMSWWHEPALPIGTQLYTTSPQRQPEQEPRNIRERWNIERDGDDLLVCFNEHEKSEGCRYERYVLADTSPPQRQPEQELADIPYILADKVREALDRQACPDAFMRIAYESIIKNYTTPPQPEQEHFALKHRIAELEGAVIGLQAQLAQPEQDSVAMADYMALMEKYAFLKAQRTWVGLTDKEIETIWRKVEAGDFHDCVLPFAEKLEAKLKEKNT